LAEVLKSNNAILKTINFFEFLADYGADEGEDVPEENKGEKTKKDKSNFLKMFFFSFNKFLLI